MEARSSLSERDGDFEIGKVRYRSVPTSRRRRPQSRSSAERCDDTESGPHGLCGGDRDNDEEERLKIHATGVRQARRALQLGSLRHRQDEVGNVTTRRHRGRRGRKSTEVLCIRLVYWTLTLGSAGFLLVLLRVRSSMVPLIRRTRLRVDDATPMLLDIPFLRSYGRSPGFVLPNESLIDTLGPDWGGLVFLSLSDPLLFRRTIDPKDVMYYARYRHELLDDMDVFPDLWYKYYHDEELDYQECRRTSWRSLHLSNCNTFHEQDIGRTPLNTDSSLLSNTQQHYDAFYLNSGYYRDVWALHDSNQMEAVLKLCQMEFPFGHDELHSARMDVLVMDRLHASPRIVDAYGMCGTSVMVEAMDREVESEMVPVGWMKQEDLHDTHDVDPQNNYTDMEKVRLALSMVEAIADLHGYSGGTIVHEDVQPAQWMWSPGGIPKLGDFNVAHVMEWNDKMSKYCQYYDGTGYGNFRSPEEYNGDLYTDKIDVFSVGNLIYALLTGLWPFFENTDDQVVKNQVTGGTKPYIDERYRKRSPLEAKLVELLERCLEHRPQDRPEIFEVVADLQKVVASMDDSRGTVS